MCIFPKTLSKCRRGGLDFLRWLGLHMDIEGKSIWKLESLKPLGWSIFITFTCFSQFPIMNSSMVTNPTYDSLYRSHFQWSVQYTKVYKGVLWMSEISFKSINSNKSYPKTSLILSPIPFYYQWENGSFNEQSNLIVLLYLTRFPLLIICHYLSNLY